MVVMRSCCCCNMRTGSLLVAVLYMLFTGLILIGLSLMLAYFNDNNLRSILYTVFNDLLYNPYTPIADKITFSILSIRNVLIASLVLKSFYFILCLLLFIGAAKESYGFMVPWLVADFIRQVLLFAAFVFVAWSLYILSQRSQISDSIVVIYCLLLIITIVSTFYFWLAVIGAAQQFRQAKQQVNPEEIKQQQFASDDTQETYY